VARAHRSLSPAAPLFVEVLKRDGHVEPLSKIERNSLSTYRYERRAA
jgi:hypothetical protein